MCSIVKGKRVFYILILCLSILGLLAISVLDNIVVYIDGTALNHPLLAQIHQSSHTPKIADSYNHNQTLQIQKERTSIAQQVCMKYGKRVNRWKYVSSKDGLLYNQAIIQKVCFSIVLLKYFSNELLLPQAFLRIENPPAIVCYNQKVASNSWMSLFGKLHHDPEVWNAYNKIGHLYE